MESYKWKHTGAHYRCWAKQLVGKMELGKVQNLKCFSKILKCFTLTEQNPSAIFPTFGKWDKKPLDVQIQVESNAQHPSVPQILHPCRTPPCPNNCLAWCRVEYIGETNWSRCTVVIREWCGWCVGILGMIWSDGKVHHFKRNYPSCIPSARYHG